MTPTARTRASSRLPIVLALLAFAALPPILGAQTAGQAVVRGRITDQGGQPLPDARVSLSGTEGYVRTLGNGRYELRADVSDSARLRVSAIGYEPVERDVALRAGTLTENFALVRAVHTVPEITVTSLAPDELAGIPGSTAIVGPGVLQKRAPVSLMDALRTVPGLTTADEDPYGLNLNVGIRGLPPRRSSRTLLLEDGIPILLGPYGDPSMHYAPPRESIERIEVIKGSGQIMNGPQTVGGVVNLVTQAPRTDGPHGHLTLGAGDLGYRNGQLFAGTGRDGNGVSVDYVFRQGDGVRLEQGHKVHNAIVKGLLALGGDQSLLLKGGLWDESSRISETGLTQEEFEADPFSLPFSAAGRFDVRRYVGQAVHQARLGAAQLRTNLYFSSTDRASWRQSGESEERIEEDEYAEDFNCQPGATDYSQCGNQGRPRNYRVFGIDPRLSLDYALGNLPSTLDVGLRFHLEEVRRRQFLGNTPTSREDDAVLTRHNEIESLVFAGFLQNRMRVGDFTLSPAVRIERVTQDNENRFPGSEALLEDSYTEVLPGFGATYNRIAGATLFAGVHRGFAPPRPADIYDPEPGQSIVLVDPETSWNWEAGVRLAPRAGVGVDATLFRMDFGNEIIEAPASEGQRFINAGKTTHQGFELAGFVSLGTLRRALDDLTLTAAYTFVPTARFNDDDGRGEEIAGNRLPYAPRHLFSASATFAHRSGVSIGSSLEHTAEQFGDEENTVEPSEDGQDGILPSYTVVSAFGSYAIPGTRASLRLSVRNLFDEVYITQRNEGIYTGVRRLVRGEIRYAF
jgi:Fe(3+) dicitrate transport protein